MDRCREVLTGRRIAPSWCGRCPLHAGPPAGPAGDALRPARPSVDSHCRRSWTRRCPSSPRSWVRTPVRSPPPTLWPRPTSTRGCRLVFAFTYSVAMPLLRGGAAAGPVVVAMCAWGEALARGPFLNGVMTEANAGPAYEAAQRALALLSNRNTPAERGLIQAMAVRYVKDHDPDTRAPHDSRLRPGHGRGVPGASRGHGCGDLLRRIPHAPEPNRGQYRLTDPFVQSFHRVLEGVLALDIRHPGACHLYVHGTEATRGSGEGPGVRRISGGTASPGAGHPEHTCPPPTPTTVWDSGNGGRCAPTSRPWKFGPAGGIRRGGVYAATTSDMLLLRRLHDGTCGLACGRRWPPRSTAGPGGGRSPSTTPESSVVFGRFE